MNRTALAWGGGLVVVAFLAMEATATAATVVINGATTLTEDIVCDASPCVLITGSGFTVDGGRHTVECGSQAVCVQLSSATSVTLENLEIVGGSEGIVISGGSQNVVQNVQIASFFAGVTVDASTNNLLDGLRVVDSYYAIYLNLATGNTVSSVTALDNIGSSIALFDSDNNVIFGNTVKNAFESGIFVDFYSTNNVVESNVTTLNQTGIEIRGDSNTISGNRSSRNIYGIFLTFGAAGNLIDSNAARRNSGFDLVDGSNDCSVNTWTNNRFRTATSACLD